MKPDLKAIQGMRSVAEQVYPVVPDRIRLADLFRRHNFRGSDPRSLQALLRRWQPSNGAIAVRVLWQNTFLMRIVGKVDIVLPIGFLEKDVTITEKPDTLDRAQE